MLIAALTLCLAASGPDALEHGRAAYEAGNYSEAIHDLDAAAHEAQAPLGKRSEARLYLASSLRALGQPDQARRVLDELFTEDPNAVVDPSLFPPKFMELVSEARAAHPPPAPKIAEPVAPPTVAPPAQPAATVETSAPGSTQRTLGVIAGIGGLATLAAGLGFGIAAYSDWQAEKTAPDATAWDSDRRRADSEIGVSNVLYGVGAAAVAAGAIIYFTAPKGTQVSAIATPSGWSLAVRAQF